MFNETSSTTGSRRGGAPDGPPLFNGIAQEVLDDLNAIGFNRPVEFLIKHDLERVRLAVDLLKAQPDGSVRNPAGLVRSWVTTPGAIPAVRRPQPQETSVFRSK